MTSILENEMKLASSGDEWGECTVWAFALCDYLTDYDTCPDYWDYNQSPFGSDVDSYEYGTICNAVDLKDISIEDLHKFSKSLYVKYEELKKAGKDY